MGLDQWIFRKENEDVYDNEGNIIECHDTEMIYWRKCNQIHGWFDRLNNGVENCGDYPVTIEQLTELRDTCQKVIDNHELAGKLLPHMRGCFFGAYDYDKYYYKELEHTIKDINEFLDDDHTGEEFYYHAWW